MAVRLLQWNANGILAHCQEFQQLLATHNFDVICIQESFLKPDTTVFGATDQQLKVVSSLSSVMDLSIQKLVVWRTCQAVNVRTTLGTITVVNVYVPPTHDAVPPPFDDLFQQNNTIIVGDMNARNRLWGAVQKTTPEEERWKMQLSRTDTSSSTQE